MRRQALMYPNRGVNSISNTATAVNENQKPARNGATASATSTRAIATIQPSMGWIWRLLKIATAATVSMISARASMKQPATRKKAITRTIGASAVPITEPNSTSGVSRRMLCRAKK